MASPVIASRHDVENPDHCRVCADCRRTHNKRVRAHAQGRALKLLARAFQIEYAALYLQELAKENIVDAPTEETETDE